MVLSTTVINNLRQYRCVVDCWFVSNEHCNKLATRRFLVVIAIVPISPLFVIFLTVLLYVTVGTYCFILFFLLPPPVGKIKERQWVAKWLHKLYRRPGRSITSLVGPPSGKQPPSHSLFALLIDTCRLLTSWKI